MVDEVVYNTIQCNACRKATVYMSKTAPFSLIKYLGVYKKCSHIFLVKMFSMSHLRTFCRPRGAGPRARTRQPTGNWIPGPIQGLVGAHTNHWPLGISPQGASYNGNLPPSRQMLENLH